MTADFLHEVEILLCIYLVEGRNLDFCIQSTRSAEMIMSGCMKRVCKHNNISMVLLALLIGHMMSRIKCSTTARAPLPRTPLPWQSTPTQHPLPWQDTPTQHPLPWQSSPTQHPLPWQGTPTQHPFPGRAALPSTPFPDRAPLPAPPSLTEHPYPAPPSLTGHSYPAPPSLTEQPAQDSCRKRTAE